MKKNRAEATATKPIAIFLFKTLTPVNELFTAIGFDTIELVPLGKNRSHGDETNRKILYTTPTPADWLHKKIAAIESDAIDRIGSASAHPDDRTHPEATAIVALLPRRILRELASDDLPDAREQPRVGKDIVLIAVLLRMIVDVHRPRFPVVRVHVGVEVLLLLFRVGEGRRVDDHDGVLEVIADHVRPVPPEAFPEVGDLGNLQPIVVAVAQDEDLSAFHERRLHVRGFVVLVGKAAVRRIRTEDGARNIRTDQKDVFELDIGRLGSAQRPVENDVVSHRVAHDRLYGEDVVRDGIHEGLEIFTGPHRVVLRIDVVSGKVVSVVRPDHGDRVVFLIFRAVFHGPSHGHPQCPVGLVVEPVDVEERMAVAAVAVTLPGDFSGSLRRDVGGHVASMAHSDIARFLLDVLQEADLRRIVSLHLIETHPVAVDEIVDRFPLR
mmetsp:Transcript_24637/g.57830  ORF Transcript_24637/g.57830 Transcript_24637/m.57830 type:complete len:439 (+) Transcript_24637:22-1338(+)